MKITYGDKVALNENPEVDDINKFKADDINEIKKVVNANMDTLTTLSDELETCNTYSSSETECGVWNGEKLYRKAVTYEKSAITSTSIDLAHGISNMGTLLHCYGSVQRSNNIQNNLPFVIPDSANYYCYVSDITLTEITLRTSQLVLNGLISVQVIFEYTKD